MTLLEHTGPARPRPRWSVRGHALVGYLALAVLVLGLGWWGTQVEIAGAVIAPGRVQVESNRQVVQHPEGGVVEDILVREGDSVREGAVLLRLDTSQLRSDLAAVEGQYFELVARRGRLEAERDGADSVTFDPELVAAAAGRPELRALMEGQRRLFEARRDSFAGEVSQLTERKNQIAAQVEGFDAQIAALDRQLQLIRQELTNKQTLLDKGLIQASQVLALQREEARLSGQIGEVRARRAEAAARMIENDVAVLRLAKTRREEAITRLRDLGYRELELAEKRRQLKERLARSEIRAPVSGRVYGLQVTAPRAVITPAAPLMYIIPDGRPLVIEVQVDPLHVDQVTVGQEVRLNFASFDQRTTPELQGRITRISPDAFADEATGRSYYRAEIELEPGEMDKLGDRTLLPGMPVQAFIVTSQRTPLDYLTRPMRDFFNRAFRED